MDVWKIWIWLPNDAAFRCLTAHVGVLCVQLLPVQVGPVPDRRHVVMKRPPVKDRGVLCTREQ